MCGRFVQTSSPQLLAQRLGAVDTITHVTGPRYNVAPSTPIPALIDADGRRLGLLQWGLVPSWSAAPDSGPRPINARCEGAATSRLFGPALARRRCIVPVDGWYEWTDEGGARQPWLLAPESGGPDADAPVAVAALWSMWRGAPSSSADGPSAPPLAPLSTVALMTTAATGRAAEVHDRMPLVVPADLLDDWLDPGRRHAENLLAVLTTREITLRVTRVSRRVNDVRNDDASLVGPVVD
jgi:putative SOS response-associated peptidase YedK